MREESSVSAVPFVILPDYGLCFCHALASRRLVQFGQMHIQTDQRKLGDPNPLTYASTQPVELGIKD